MQSAASVFAISALGYRVPEPAGGEPVISAAGDSFVAKPSLVGVWKTIETVRKIFVAVG